ncbi:FAD-dependent oxidoreductase [Streptomyces sp. NPDC059009]|uniref:FAD-dependent oxidoreductase n=1 Tax=Streptomyces sp. NPDC059009 TaxID=3346694 RepID=UPI0036836502
MNRSTTPDSLPDAGTSVLIVGAGPTGLLLGCELRRRGIDCTVIDQAPAIDQRTRAVMVHAASLETLCDLGLRSETERHGIRQQRIAFHLHHGAVYTVEFSGLDTPYPYYVNIPQPAMEAILARAFTERGGRLLRAVRYRGHHEDAAAQHLTAELTDGKGTFRIQARYLIGADGAASTVRAALGLSFDGTTYPMSYLLAEGSPQQRPDPDTSSMHIGPDGAVSLLPLPGGSVRVAGPATADLLTRDTDVTAAAFRAAVDRLGFGPALRLTHTDRLAHYQVHERLAARFHHGRTALAGDAAHLNSPAGGQAMNTGFADAVALAWRLAALVRGRTGDDLLADYARERRAAATDVARTTGVLHLLQAMRDATTPHARRHVQESLDGYAEAWSQLYATYPAGTESRTLLPRRETHRLDVGARVPGHTPEADGPTLLHHPAARPAPGLAPPGTPTRPLTTRQAAWLPAGAQAVLVRPDRHVAAVIPAPGTPRTPDHTREEVPA